MASIERESVVNIRTEADIVASRKAGRDVARGLGFGSADQTRLATAISELTRNVINFAGEGVCLIRDESEPTAAAIIVVVEDHGPGIPDIEEAMTDGFSTVQSQGMGLSGARRLVDEFEIQSEPGHTIITMKMTRRRV